MIAAAVLAAVSAEALAFYVFAEMVANGYETRHAALGAPSAVAFMVVALVGFGLPRLAGELALSRRATVALVGAIAYVVLYGILRIEFAHDIALWNLAWVGDFVADAEKTAGDGAPAIFGGALLIACFVRSMWRGGDDVELESIPRALGFPLVAVLVLVVIGAGSDRAGLIARGGAAFFAVAIIAMALSQSARSGASLGSLRTGSVTAVLLAGTAAATVVCLAVLGLFVAIAGDEIANVLFAVIGRVLYVILTPIAWVLVHFFEWIFPDSGVSRQLDNLQGGLDDLRPGDNGSDSENGQSAFARFAGLLLRSGILVVVLALVVGVVILVIRVRRRGASGRALASESASSGSLGADLAAGFRSLFARKSQAPAAQQPEGIFQLYSQVLGDAARMGRARPAATTPEEFSPTLVNVFHSPVTDEITAAFEEARYGGRSADPALVTELEARWRQSRLAREET